MMRYRTNITPITWKLRRSSTIRLSELGHAGTLEIHHNLTEHQNLSEIQILENCGNGRRRTIPSNRLINY